ncbi:hypothetical protein ACLVWU_08660 [Bdellovibrio sp. HCB290]|uniref:hypothetical protein n=1 Tax=Bdellovibrio sp. HCB290 TaxID=3394356 RepID=UPI0039B56400
MELSIKINSVKIQFTRRLWLLGLSLSVTASLLCRSAVAFDPTTLAIATKAVVGGVSGVDETLDAGFAFSELLEELEVETEADDEVGESVQRLEELKKKTYGLYDSKEDLVRYFERDLKRAKTASSKLRAIKNMIESSKRIASIMGVRPKTGQAAASIQQMRINTMILNELQEIRRNQESQVLKENEARYRRSILLDQIVKEEKARQGRI